MFVNDDIGGQEQCYFDPFLWHYCAIEQLHIQ